MDQFLAQHGDAIVAAVVGLATGSFVTFRLTRTNRAGRDLVDQSGARAGGDMVGGNKSTRNERAR